jgi:hypothetical protein
MSHEEFDRDERARSCTGGGGGVRLGWRSPGVVLAGSSVPASSVFGFTVRRWGARLAVASLLASIAAVFGGQSQAWACDLAGPEFTMVGRVVAVDAGAVDAQEQQEQQEQVVTFEVETLRKWGDSPPELGEEVRVQYSVDDADLLEVGKSYLVAVYEDHGNGGYASDVDRPPPPEAVFFCDGRGTRNTDGSFLVSEPWPDDDPGAVIPTVGGSSVSGSADDGGGVDPVAMGLGAGVLVLAVGAAGLVVVRRHRSTGGVAE